MRIAWIFLFHFALINAAWSSPVINSYNLSYTLNFEEKKLFCKAELSLGNVHPHDTLSLLLYRLLNVKEVTDEFGREIEFDQTVTCFSDWDVLQVNHISVFMRSMNPISEKRTIHIWYEGYLYGYTETGMSYVRDNIDPNFTILRMDSYAYPVVGTTSWEKNRTAGFTNFNYEVSVIVPDSLAVVNGGQLVSAKDKHGYTKYVYQNSKPAWRIDIVISKYHKISNGNFNVYHFPEDSTGAKNVLHHLQASDSLFTKWFGQVSSSGFSVIEIPDGWGSQTDVTCILQTASAFKDQEKLYELYHEVSHIWNVPALDKSPCRLESEGLAVFLQYLVTEKLSNNSTILDASASKTVDKLKLRFLKDTVAAATPIIDCGKKQMTDLSYSKGMLFFYLLYKKLGEPTFLETIREFYHVYRETGATTAEFVHFLNQRLKTHAIKMLTHDWIMTNVSSQKIMNKASMDELFKAW